MDDIINCQISPLIKIGLGYVGESSCCKDENVKEEAMLHDEDGKKPHEEKPSSKDEEKGFSLRQHNGTFQKKSLLFPSPNASIYNELDLYCM